MKEFKEFADGGIPEECPIFINGYISEFEPLSYSSKRIKELENSISKEAMYKALIEYLGKD